MFEANIKINNFIIAKAYNKAKIYLKKNHKKLTDEHIIDFILHFINVNYGIDVHHSKIIIKHIKDYVHNHYHHRTIKKGNDIKENDIENGNN